MLSHSKVPLRASERKQQQRLKLRRQAYIRLIVLITIIVVVCIADFVFSINSESGVGNKFESDFIITKSVAIGAILNWFAQSVFIWFVFRYTGAHLKQNIVTNLYFGQIIKWLIVLIGFSIVFMTAKSFAPALIILGFLIMQIGHFIILWKSG